MEKSNKSFKSVIIILLVLLILSIAALTVRIIYINFFKDKQTTEVVSDNMIGNTEITENTVITENTEGAVITETADTGASSENSTSATDTRADSDSAQVIGTEADETSREASDGETQKPSVKLELYKGQGIDNTPYYVENMLPGDTEVKYMAVKVYHNSDVTVYFSAKVKEQTKDLAKVLRIKVTHDDSGEVIYDGAFSDVGKDGYGITLPAKGSTETVARYKLEVTLPTSVGNEHQAARLVADFNWFVKDDSSLESPPTDDALIAVLRVMFILIIVTVAVILLLLRRKNKEAHYAE